MDALDELRAAVQRDPQRVANAASQLVTAARESGDTGTLSRALGVLGRARRALGDIAVAEADLDAAVRAGVAAGDDELVADAYVGLAGVLIWAGRSDTALEHLSTAERLGSARVRAYAALQRAVVAQKTGRTADALAAYDSALPTLRRLGARTDAAMVAMNRGVIRAQAGEFEDALADLTEAHGLFEADGSAYGVAQVRHGIGWVHARRGDLVAALEQLDEAAALFRDLGYGGGEVETDRVEVLLSAGLTDAGGELAAEAARRAAAAGDHLVEAQMWLMCARAAFLRGDRSGGARVAELAHRLFVDQGSVAWQRLARLEAVRAGAADADSAELAGLAVDLEDAGHARSAATAVGLAALHALARGDVDRADELAADCARRAGRLRVFEVRVLAEYTLAMCAAGRGDRDRALAHVRASLDELHSHRGAFAAPDARAAVAIHAQDLSALGLRLALSTGSPAQLLEWIELTRAGRHDLPAARPPADPAAAAEMAALRSAVAAVRAAEVAGDDTADPLVRQRDLERAVHARWLRTQHRPHPAQAVVDASPDGTALAQLPADREADRPALAQVPAGVQVLADREPDGPAWAQLPAALGDRRLVELAVVDDRLVAVRVDSTDLSTADLGPATAVFRAAATASTALRAALTPGRSDVRRDAGVVLLHRACAELDRLLGPALRGDGGLVLVVPPELNTVPWQRLPTVRGRPVVVAPSATWWLAASQTSVAPMGTTSGTSVAPMGTTSGTSVAPVWPMVAVAGPRLVEATAEAYAVAACYPTATVLSGAEATTAALSTAMSTAATVHVACHAHLRRDNPLWSSLELFDGPLCGYDIEPLPRTPSTVVLSGCETGVGVATGDALLGLTTAFLRRGTESVVASLCPLPDTAATRLTMTALHSGLAAGDPPAIAIARLCAHPDRPGSREESLVVTALTCFGAR